MGSPRHSDSGRQRRLRSASWRRRALWFEVFERKPTGVAELPSVAALTVTKGIASVRDLAATVFARQTTAGVEQLPLLVAQGAAVALVALAAIRLAVQWDASSMDTPNERQDTLPAE